MDSLEGLRDLIRKQNFEIAKLKEEKKQARKLLAHIEISSRLNIWTRLTKQKLSSAINILKED